MLDLLCVLAKRSEVELRGSPSRDHHLYQLQVLHVVLAVLAYVMLLVDPL